MKFYINTLNDGGSGMRYNTKEEFLHELSLMIDDCIANGGTFFDANIDADASCFYDKNLPTEVCAKPTDIDEEMCNAVTNCTENCKSCMEEEKKSEISPMQFVGEIAINMCRYISKNEEETNETGRLD